MSASLFLRKPERWSIKSYLSYSDLDAAFDAAPFISAPGYDIHSGLTIFNVLGEWEVDEKLSLHAKYSAQRHETAAPIFGNDSKGDYHYVETYFHHEPSDVLGFLGGFVFHHEKLLSVPSAPEIRLYSPYLVLQGKLPIHKSLRIELGGRYNQHSAYGSNFTAHVNPFYVLRDKYKLYALYSSSFRAPEVSHLYGNFGANEDLTPERSFHWEAGIEQYDVGTRNSLGWQWRVSYFMRNIEQLITYQPSIQRLLRECFSM